MILASLKVGLRRAWAAKRMLLIYYLGSLLCGAVLAVPLRSLLSEKVGHSLLGEALGGRFDMDFLADFVTNFTDFGDTWIGLAVMVPGIYLLLNVFLSGGALSVFATEERYSTAMFWSGAAGYFGRFLRLWLLALPVFAIFFLIVFLEKGATRLFFGADPYQSVTYWAGWVRTGLMLLAALLGNMYFDYARIYAVLHDERKMRLAWLAGLKFMFANLGKTLILALSMAAIGLVMMVVYNLAANALSAPNAAVVVLLVALQQLYVMFRMYMKLTAFAAQTSLYQNLGIVTAAVAPQPSTPEAADGLAEGMEGMPA